MNFAKTIKGCADTIVNYVREARNNANRSFPRRRESMEKINEQNPRLRG